MSCHVVCTISAREECINSVLDVLKDAGGEGTLTLSDAAVGRKTPKLWYSRGINVGLTRYGDTFAASFAMARFSSAALSLFSSVIEALPTGEYGIAHSFSWDHDQDSVCVNGYDEPYHGGGDELPWPVDDLDVDYMYEDEAKELLRSKGWRRSDMKTEALERVAEAESLRWWMMLHRR